MKNRIELKELKRTINSMGVEINETVKNMMDKLYTDDSLLKEQEYIDLFRALVGEIICDMYEEQNGGII